MRVCRVCGRDEALVRFPPSMSSPCPSSRGGRPSRVDVEVGLSDELVTEVRAANLAVGAQVITEEAEPETARTQTRSPGMMGGGRRAPR